MYKTPIGEYAEKCWLEISQHFPFVKLGTFVIMPNHIHRIIIINKTENYDNANAISDGHPIAVVGAQNLAPLPNHPRHHPNLLRRRQKIHLGRNPKIWHPLYGVIKLG